MPPKRKRESIGRRHGNQLSRDQTNIMVNLCQVDNPASIRWRYSDTALAKSVAIGLNDAAQLCFAPRHTRCPASGYMFENRKCRGHRIVAVDLRRSPIIGRWAFFFQQG